MVRVGKFLPNDEKNFFFVGEMVQAKIVFAGKMFYQTPKLITLKFPISDNNGHADADAGR